MNRLSNHAARYGGGGAPRWVVAVPVVSTRGPRFASFGAPADTVLHVQQWRTAAARLAITRGGRSHRCAHEALATHAGVGGEGGGRGRQAVQLWGEAPPRHARSVVRKAA